MITSVIYDCDGVLLDTEPIYTQAANILLSQFNKSLPCKLKLSLLGQSGPNVANTIVKELQLPITPSYYEKEVKLIEQSLFPNCKIMTGAEEAVSELIKLNMSLGIATSSISKSFNIKIRDKLEFFSQFKIIIKGDNVLNPKPNPEIFLKAFTQLNELNPSLTLNDCLVVEDSPSGLRGALAAGMQVVWLVDPIYEKEWLDQFVDLIKVPRFSTHRDVINFITSKL